MSKRVTVLLSESLSKPVASVPGSFGPFAVGTVSLLVSIKYTGWYGALLFGFVERMYEPVLALPLAVS